MKQNAAALTGHKDAGVVQLFGLFKGDAREAAAHSPAPDRPLGRRDRALPTSARAPSSKA